MNIRLRRLIQTAGTALFLSASLTFPAFSASPAGSLEAAGHTAISGWAYDPENPGSRITVELLLSGDGGPGDSVILEAEASESRPELTETAGSSDCGFSVSVDWESLAGDSYTITAEAVVDGSRFPLEGTLTYTKSEGGASSRKPKKTIHSQSADRANSSAPSRRPATATAPAVPAAITAPTPARFRRPATPSLPTSRFSPSARRS